MIQLRKLQRIKQVGPSTRRVAIAVAKRAIAVVRWLNLDKRDCTGIAGISIFGAGVSAIFWPAGLIAVGVVLLYVAHGGVNSGIPKRGDGSSGDGGATRER